MGILEGIAVGIMGAAIGYFCGLNPKRVIAMLTSVIVLSPLLLLLLRAIFGADPDDLASALPEATSDTIMNIISRPSIYVPGPLGFFAGLVVGSIGGSGEESGL